MDLVALLDHEPADLARAEAKVREVAQLRAELRIARLRAIEQEQDGVDRRAADPASGAARQHARRGSGGGSGYPPAARPSPRRARAL
jgi:hypothetical protein